MEVFEFVQIKRAIQVAAETSIDRMSTVGAFTVAANAASAAAADAD